MSFFSSETGITGTIDSPQNWSTDSLTTPHVLRCEITALRIVTTQPSVLIVGCRQSPAQSGSFLDLLSSCARLVGRTRIFWLCCAGRAWGCLQHLSARSHGIACVSLALPRAASRGPTERTRSSGELNTISAAEVTESNLSSSVLPSRCSEKSMATEEAWMCSICRDVRRDVASANPCKHTFCVGCIQRWAMLRDSCPLCRTAMKTIRVSVRGDDEYVECIVSPPAVPVPVGFGTATGPSGTAPSAPPSPGRQRKTGSRREWRRIVKEEMGKQILGLRRKK
ncbi:uncharacterized protein LOC116652932 [Coturnix japonica]|uniref:uncharacterized protein LOC116652932 n=1 Tax=Coturnix japonica TaxID=93934 RepID=UPI0013A5DE02|nr:uncharacterized protein LOC116652932 [Coturnix japonica]